MSPVLGLLDRGRNAPESVSALDAVMGDDWAIVAFDKPRKPPQLYARLKAAHAEDVARSRGGGSGGGFGTVPGRAPQAMVKMIRKGGASDVRGLKAQMEYLSREGRVALERSERFFGTDLDADQAEVMQRSWRMPREGEGRADRTSHFVVSFPEGTDPVRAYRAGRDWANRIFGTGDFGGDAFDYYTAFHTDQAHPHLHVVVHRRGLHNGEWLKVSRRSDINYDSMRVEMVRSARTEGIRLEAATRFERGIHTRPIPDAEYRRARSEGRVPVAPEHTRETAIRAAAALIHYARTFARDARRIERETPEEAAAARWAAHLVSRGQELTEAVARHRAAEEADMASPRLEDRREQVRRNFQEMEKTVEETDDAAERMRRLRQIAAIKAETAPLLRDPDELRSYIVEDESGRYRGLPASGTQDPETRRQADERAARIAERYGVDRAATLERHSGKTPSLALADQYRAAEEAERRRSRAERGEAPETDDQRREALGRMHAEIREVYAEARTRSRTDAETRSSEAARTRIAPPVSDGQDREPDPGRRRTPPDAEDPSAEARRRAGETPAQGGEDDLPERVRRKMAEDADRMAAVDRAAQARQRAAEQKAAERRAEDGADRRGDQDIGSRSRTEDDDDTGPRRRGPRRR